MSGGMTATTGFIATTVQEEVTDLNASFLTNVDGGLDLAPDQPFGQIIGIFAAKYASLMELGATVYNAINPAAAEGTLLANVALISGTLPQVATYSTVVATLTLNATTTVLAGATAVVLNQPANVWVLEANVTSTTAGTYTGTFRSQTPGPFVANAGTLTVIGTPTIGWTAVTNAADAVQGLAADTDASLRIKRNAELFGQGSGDLDAIRAAVLKVSGVIQAFVFENTSLATDASSLPGKSFRVVVWDGASLASNTAIAQAIWDSKPAGIAAYGTGTNSGVAVDSTGTNRTILFDRAIQVPIYVSCSTTPSVLTSAQTTGVKAALQAYADANYNLGVTVVDLPLRASALISGVTDVPTFYLDTHSTPVDSVNIPITGLQIATLATTDILVNGV